MYNELTDLKLVQGETSLYPETIINSKNCQKTWASEVSNQANVENKIISPIEQKDIVLCIVKLKH